MKLIVEFTSNMRWQSDLLPALKVIRNSGFKYNWLISEPSGIVMEYKKTGETRREFNPLVDRIRKNRILVSDEELLNIVFKSDIRFVWAVFSAFKKDYAVNEVKLKLVPYADWNEGYWHENTRKQLDDAELEIACIDGKYTIFVTENPDLFNILKETFSDAGYLVCENSNISKSKSNASRKTLMEVMYLKSVWYLYVSVGIICSGNIILLFLKKIGISMLIVGIAMLIVYFTNWYRYRGHFRRKGLMENEEKIVIDADKIQIQQVNKEYKFKISDIEKVVGYAKDLFSYDQKCLRIYLINGKEVEVSEDMFGWSYFVWFMLKNIDKSKIEMHNMQWKAVSV